MKIFHVCFPICPNCGSKKVVLDGSILSLLLFCLQLIRIPVGTGYKCRNCDYRWTE